MKKLLVYMEQYRVHAVLGPLFKLTEALFELFIPLVVADIIDNGISSGSKSYVISRAVLMAVLGIIGFICAVTAQYFAAKASVGFSSKLRRAIFDKVQNLSFTKLDNIGTSTLITRITGDVNQVQTGVNLTLRLLLRSPFIVFGAMIMAFTVDVKSALIFTVAIPLMAVVVVAIMAVTVPLYKSVQARLDKVLCKTRETLLGVRVIRAFCKETEETTEFSRENSALNTAQKHVGKISALMNPLTYVIVNTAVIFIVWIGGKRVYSGALSTGEVVALYNYMSQILVELIKLANMIITLNRALASASRIEGILSTESKLQTLKNNTPNFSTDTIEFKNVSFKYDAASEESLSNISFSAKSNENIGIIGATGSGKSTLVNLLPAFYSATNGSVIFKGVNVENIPEAVLRNKIGIVMQKPVLFKGTVRENLLLGGKTNSDDELYTALKTAQAYDFVMEKGGLDFLIEQNGRNLSGGQKQRLSVARALVGNPEVLILDDSSSALDFATEASLRHAIDAISPKPTVFTVSQRVSTVMHADKILVLDDGKMMGLGTHDSLLKDCPLYAEICKSQLEKEGV